MKYFIITNRTKIKVISRGCSGDGQQHSPEEIPGNL